MRLTQFLEKLLQGQSDKYLESLIYADNFPILFSSSFGRIMVMLEDSGLFSYYPEADQVDMLFIPGTEIIRPYPRLTYSGKLIEEPFDSFNNTHFRSSISVHPMQKQKIPGLSSYGAMAYFLREFIQIPVSRGIEFFLPCVTEPVYHPDKLEAEAFGKR